MEQIKKLKMDLSNNNPETRARAVERLTKMASEGNEEAAEVLREVLEAETDSDVLQKVFNLPIQSETDRRCDLVEDLTTPLLEKFNKPNLKNLFIERVKEALEVFVKGRQYHPTKHSFFILTKLLNVDDIFTLADNCLKMNNSYVSGIFDSLEEYLSGEEYSKILQKILSQLKKAPNAYANNFVEIFTWYLSNPHPDTVELIKEVWLSLPPNFKEAIRLYYYNKMGDFYKRLAHEREFLGTVLLPSKHPMLQWLESFEQGIVTSSPSSYYVLQRVAEKIGLHLKDEVKQIETEEPSPITIERKERKREENIELIPIDKCLGQYFPEDQLIKLYMQEIRETAKHLGVSTDELKTIVEFHESAHAIVHLGRDAEGRNFNTGAFSMVDGGADPSPLHETLAQLLTYHCLKNDPKLLKCFMELNERQPKVYTLWKNFKDVSLELIRNILVGMREGRIEASFEMFKKLTL